MVEFSHFRADTFYYKIRHKTGVTEDVPLQNGSTMEREKVDVYQFPVDIDDIGNGTMLAVDNAIMLMRWIRKAMHDKTLIKL